MKEKSILALARKLAISKKDNRNQRHGAVGIRKDGVIVASCNGHQRNPAVAHHAEARVIRKLGKGGILYVVRVLPDGSLGNSTPCSKCQKLIHNQGIRKVVYSASDSQLMTWYPLKQKAPVGRLESYDGSLLTWWPKTQAKPKNGSYGFTADCIDSFHEETNDWITGLQAWLPKDAGPITAPQTPAGLVKTDTYKSFE